LATSLCNNLRFTLGVTPKLLIWNEIHLGRKLHVWLHDRLS
jgi:hypothetical protein